MPLPKRLNSGGRLDRALTTRMFESLWEGTKPSRSAVIDVEEETDAPPIEDRDTPPPEIPHDLLSINSIMDPQAARDSSFANELAAEEERQYSAFMKTIEQKQV